MFLQALELIQELQKHYPIKRCPLRIRVAAHEEEVPALLEKLNEWKSTIISKEGSSGQLSVVSFYLSFNSYKQVWYVFQFLYQFCTICFYAWLVLAKYILKQNLCLDKIVMMVCDEWNGIE